MVHLDTIGIKTLTQPNAWLEQRAGKMYSMQSYDQQLLYIDPL